jgi:Zn-dependent M16 (insulinase) family peptidase
MVGGYSNPSNWFFDRLSRNLFPDSTYQYSSGGTPSSIANLTLQQVRERHETFYRPCNALFFHYGSFNISEILKKISDVITEFDTGSVNFSSELTKQPRWESPRSIIEEGPEESGDGMRSILAWMLNDTMNHTDDLNFEVLGSLLSQKHASPL